jgi:hypothetical protein
MDQKLRDLLAKRADERLKSFRSQITILDEEIRNRKDSPKDDEIEETFIVYNWRLSSDNLESLSIDLQLKTAVCVALRYALIKFYTTKSVSLKNERNKTEMGFTLKVGTTGGFTGRSGFQLIYDAAFIQNLISTVLTTALPASFDEIVSVRLVAKQTCLKKIEEQLNYMKLVGAIPRPNSKEKKLSKTDEREDETKGVEDFAAQFQNAVETPNFFIFSKNMLIVLRTFLNSKRNADPRLQKNIDVFDFGIIAIDNLLIYLNQCQENDRIYERKLETYYLIRGVILNFKEDKGKAPKEDKGKK